MLILLLVLLFPVWAFAACAQWWECPYRVRTDGTSTIRYVSIDDLRLPFAWQEIEIEGNKAVVCLQSPMPAGNTAECTQLTRTQVRDPTRLLPPAGKRFNAAALRARINDSAVSDDILERRSTGR